MHYRPAPLALILSAALLSAPAQAQDLSLSLPIACELGTSCYIQNYFDHDPAAGFSDYTCGPLGYDGHDGTDFAVPTLADMAQGVDVLAAAPGTVMGTRDEMADIAQGTPGAPDITNRECGNGVVIAHADGWETQYCHMALGSVAVAQGDVVQPGQVLGRVGLSGDTQFPHLHFSVRTGGAEIDPLDPDGAITCGAPSADTLFAEPIAYRPGGIIGAGFFDAIPDFDAIKAGTADMDLTPTSPALVAWGYVFGGRTGDQVTIAVTGPDGTIVDHAESLTATQALLFRAAGLRTPPGGWPAGNYLATIALIRDGTVMETVQHRMRIAP